MTPALSRYLKKRALPGPWVLEGTPRGDFDIAVTIPALAESEALPATLASLESNPLRERERTLVVVVVNNGPTALEATREDNLRTLETLRNYRGPLQLAWVDAASAGRELPPKEGVGSARKIGFDLALSRLRHEGPEPPLLVSLDADTLVEENYVTAIREHFRNHAEGGAVLPFRHRNSGTAAIDEAIGHYELYLRGYVLGLTWAGSPYAFHTIGSAIACRAEAYAACGGMNRRSSGEDFYFLQQLAKTRGVAHLRGTTVHPSPRPSKRVPFGTGPSVARLLATPGKELDFYPPEGFDVLKKWLDTIACHHQKPGELLLASARELSPHLADFLHSLCFLENWRKLRNNHPGPDQLLNAFHRWFDGLRTRQLLHRLGSGPCPWRKGAEAVAPLLRRLALPTPSDTRGQLEALRCYQEGNPLKKEAGNRFIMTF